MNKLINIQSAFLINTVCLLAFILHFSCSYNNHGNGSNSLYGTWYSTSKTSIGDLDVLIFSDSICTSDFGDDAKRTNYKIANDSLYFGWSAKWEHWEKEYKMILKENSLLLIRDTDTTTYNRFSRSDSLRGVDETAYEKIKGKYYTKGKTNVSGFSIEKLNDQYLVVFGGIVQENPLIIGTEFPIIIGTPYRFMLMTVDSIGNLKHFKLASNPVIETDGDKLVLYREVDDAGNQCGWEIKWDEKGRRAKQSFSIASKTEKATMELIEFTNVWSVTNYFDGVRNGLQYSWVTSSRENPNVIVNEYKNGVRDGTSWQFDNNGFYKVSYEDDKPIGDGSNVSRNSYKYETFNSYFVASGSFSKGLNYPYKDHVSDSVVVMPEFPTGTYVGDYANYVCFVKDDFGRINAIRFDAEDFTIERFRQLSYKGNTNFIDKLTGEEYSYDIRTRKLESKYDNGEGQIVREVYKRVGL